MNTKQDEHDANEPREFASPPCFAHEIDPEYSGLAPAKELVSALQELLEGERAGARIGRESLRQANESNQPESVQSLIARIQTDETSYCKMLINHIERLGSEPSRSIGSFYEKCIAIDDLFERFKFLNRGQGWVVRRVNELIPELSDQLLVSALIEMRDTHVKNINDTNLLLEAAK